MSRAKNNDVVIQIGKGVEVWAGTERKAFVKVLDRENILNLEKLNIPEESIHVGVWV